jgi:hypothetical protein
MPSHPRLEDVFKRSGLPTYTFVEPRGIQSSKNRTSYSRSSADVCFGWRSGKVRLSRWRYRSRLGIFRPMIVDRNRG